MENEKTQYPVQPAPFSAPGQGYNAPPALAYNSVNPQQPGYVMPITTSYVMPITTGYVMPQVIVGTPRLSTSPQHMSNMIKSSI